MRVLMVGVDKKSVGGMLTVISNFLNDEKYCKETNVKYISTVSRSNKLIKILKFSFVLPIIFFTILFKKIDLVHVHMAERHSVSREGTVVWLAKKMHRKTIIHLHAAEIEPWYNGLSDKKKNKTSWYFNNADKILILGENWRPFMESILGEENKSKIEVVYNAVNVPTTNLYNQNANNILFYGMLIKRKGIEDLFKAFSIAKDKIPSNILLSVYGDDDEKLIDDLMAKYNSDNRIIYGGWLKKENQKEVFSNTICHILSSYHEGLPMSILETMSYGIPNISTNIAAIPEAIVNGVNGFLIEPGDVNGLADKIVQICNDFNLRLKFSKEAYEKCNNIFSIDNQIDVVLSIYKGLLGEKNEK